MGVTTAIVAIAGTIYSIDQQKKAADEAAKAAEEREDLEQKRADVTGARERAKQVRLARAARATALAQSQSGEGTGGSGLTGAQANIGNQLTGNLSFLNKQQEISTQISNLNVSSTNKIAKYQSNAAVGSGVASVSSTVGKVV